MKDQVKNEKEKEDWKVVLLMSMRQRTGQTAHLPTLGHLTQ